MWNSIVACVSPKGAKHVSALAVASATGCKAHPFWKNKKPILLNARMGFLIEFLTSWTTPLSRKQRTGGFASHSFKRFAFFATISRNIGRDGKNL